jgi:hypothetical protein
MRSLYTVFYVLIIAFVQLSGQTEKASDRLRANAFFLRQMQQAHPTPEKNLMTDEMLVPLLPAGSGLSNFLNVELTVNETGTFRMQNESSIAVNPTNPENLIASAVDYRDTSATWIYVSHDGAKTWTNLKLGRPHKGWSASNDPSVTFDLDGTAYLVIGAFGKRSSGLQGQAVENGVYILRSTDEGRTWTSHIPVIEHRGEQTIDSTFEDKYYIWCDNSETSPFKGHLYIPWKRVWAKDSATQIVISKSTDKGDSWSSPIAVSPRLPGSSEDTTYGQSFPLAVTGPNGEIYLVWNNGIEHAVGFARSTDGGVTWTEPRLIHRYNIFGKTKEIEPGIWRHVLKDKVRAEAYPSLVVDITNGPRSGWLYLTWAADRVPNVYFSRSTDMGETWSEPVIVHSDTTNDQFWQWIALDRTNGDIAVMYLDSRDDPNNIEVASYVSYSSDGGTTWTDRRAADVSSDLRKNPFRGNVFAGDYSGCAFHNGIIYPSWVDMRSAVQNIYDSDVYTALININKPAFVENFDAITIPAEPDKIRLQWDKVVEKAFGQPLNAEEVKYVLERDGQIIAEPDGNTDEFTDTGLDKFKLYRYSIYAVAGGDTSAAVHDSAWAGGSKQPGIPSIAGYSRDESKVVVYFRIPTKRLDGVTPFVNPAFINLFKDYKPWRAKPITIADTGKIKSFNDLVKTDGFYAYEGYVVDTYKNFGPMSDTLILYAGRNNTTYSDDFNEAQMRKYLNEDGWGIATDFGKTGFSLTDSPDGNYSPMSNEKLTVFPYEGNAPRITLSFWHAAFVAKGDSAIVEYSDDGMKTWHLLAYYDRTMHTPWSEGIKDENAWLPASFNVENTGDTVYFRFRLKSNAIKQDDGWYIDDLTFSGTTGVNEDEISNNIDLYPNPAGDFVYVDFAHIGGMRVTGLDVFDVIGNKILLGYAYSFGNIKINTENLLPGMYNVVIRFNNGDFAVKKFLKY